jgi:hypothetical protein
MMRAVTEHGLWYAMPVRAGDRIRLEPLSAEHADGYLEAAGGGSEIFRWQRLGARQEGVLRKHRRRADGSWRDTVMYAIVDDDWAAVRSGLLKRLGDAA